MKSVNHKGKRKSSVAKKYNRRKALFWIVFSTLSLFILVACYSMTRQNVENQYIRVGVCGAVRKPAVYTVREGSDLSMLIRLAKGVKANADLTKVDLDFIVKHDSIYHIPAVGNENDDLYMMQQLSMEVNQKTKMKFESVAQKVSREFKQSDIREYNILYVGMPAVFVLITYYPDFNRINFVHLPHSTILLNNEYRLIDLFFTLDISPTCRIIEHTLKKRIDFYLIQDRDKFIEMIDKLGGVKLNLDKPYAEMYDMNSGSQLIDGFHTWEYIRFLDWRNIKIGVKSEKKKDLIRQDNFTVDSREWERIYEIRNQRQRYVIQGMRNSFKGLTKDQQLTFLEDFNKLFQTDMSKKLLMSLYNDILTTKDFSFGNIPGYYRSEGEKLYYFPDLPNFEMLQENEIRTWLEQKKNKVQTVY